MTIKVENHYKLHLFIFLLFSMHLFLFSTAVFIDKFLAVAICLGVLFHIQEIKFEFERRYEIIVFMVIAAYLTLAIFGFDLFVSPDLKTNQMMSFFNFGIGFIWTCYVLQSVLDVLKYIDKNKIRFIASSNDKYWKKWLILFAIIFSIFMLWPIAYNPIVMSVDSWGYLDGWYSGIYDSFRSPIYAFLISIVCYFAPTKPEVQWIAIAQIAIFSSLLATILMYFHKKWIRLRFIIPIAVILPLIPSFGLHTIVIWSDLACGMTMLWFTYVLVRIFDEVMLHDTASKKQQFSFYLQLCISMVLAYFIRSNSFLVYLVMAPVLSTLFIMKKQWKLLATVGISVFVVLLIRFPGYNILDVAITPATKEAKYYSAIHDIQAVYYGGGKLSENTVASLRKYVSNLDEPGFADALVPDFVQYGAYGYDFSELTISEFIPMYADSFIHNPFKTVRSMLYRVKNYWAINPNGWISLINYTGLCGRSSTVGYYDSDQIPELDISRQNNTLTDIMNAYIDFIQVSILKTFVWRFGFWTALMVVSAMTLVLQKRYICLLTYLPIFVYLATLFLTSGWPDYRYGLSVFFVGMFLPLVFMLSDSPDDNKTKRRRKRR